MVIKPQSMVAKPQHIYEVTHVKQINTMHAKKLQASAKIEAKGTFSAKGKMRTTHLANKLINSTSKCGIEGS